MIRAAVARTSIVLLLLVLSAAAPPVASATFPGAPGMVASGFGELRIDDPTDDRPAIVIPGGEGGSATFSPDGTMVASSVFNDSSGLSELRVHAVATGAVVANFTFDESRARPSTPAWAPDGSLYSLVQGARRGATGSTEVFRYDVQRGTGGSVSAFLPDGLYFAPVISPDGTRLAARYLEATGFPTEIVTMSLTGTARTVVPGSRGSGRPSLAFDWRPGGGYMITERRSTTDGGRLRVFDASGTLIDDYSSSTRVDRPSEAGFTPDGGHTYRNGCIEDACGVILRRIPDPEADVAPDRAASLDRVVPGAWPNITDWQPQTQPVVFIHGFAGSKLGCGGDETWLPTPFAVGDDLLDMRLGADGSSNLSGTCGVGPTGLLETAFGVSDVYGSTREWLTGLAGDRAHMFVWDWRKDPREVAPLLDAAISGYLDTPEMRAQGVSRVAIIAHSMGGLVTRAYTNDPARARRVARAVTVGTPYNGAPKALFPLAFGTEMPGAGGDLDGLLPDAEFRAFAQGLTGLFFLLPSAHYGGWLRVAGREPQPLDEGGVLDYAVGELGANRAALSRAMRGHADELDGFARKGVDLRVMLGTGLLTIAGVGIEPAPDGDGFDVVVGYADGDETVPSRSASQGPPLTTDPLGENVSLMNVCRVGHMGLTASRKVQAPLEDFLTRGTPPRRTRDACGLAGRELKFHGLTRAETGSASRRSFAPSTDGVPGVQIIDLPRSFIAVTQDGVPARIAARGTGGYVAVSAIGDGTRGAPTYYGPITGEASVQTGDGSVTVLDDGSPVKGSMTRPPGLSDTGGPQAAGPSGGGVDPGAGPPSPSASGSPAGAGAGAGAAPAVIAPAVTAVRRGTASLRLPRGGLRVDRGRVRIPVRCKTGPRCTGRVVVRAARGARRHGSAAYAVSGGRAGRVSVRLRGVSRRALRRGLRVRIALAPAGGGTGPSVTSRLRAR